MKPSKSGSGIINHSLHQPSKLWSDAHNKSAIHPSPVIAKSIVSPQKPTKRSELLTAKSDWFPRHRLKKPIFAIATINFCAAQ
jgi:hypothetical protein